MGQLKEADSALVFNDHLIDAGIYPDDRFSMKP